MRENIERRVSRIEEHPLVRRASLDYDDGEVVVIALCDRVNTEFEVFVDGLGLEVWSGPKYLGDTVGVEVVVG